ncbi:hypothetical protein BD770DRAFT_391157 [Pilaira anomala]|nr:hypothetical protein BD770DRAFT_391157 [Pilaira anomala]
MSRHSIQLLDSSVIHQLRSSLVISTLPQCLKELIHNAIDANATNIEISIDIEKFSLQVEDNGEGIQNMCKIGQRHVTSKCHTLSDVSQLKTFGFRGEALASITNEAIVQIISRHRSSQNTLEGFWRDGRIIGDKISNSKYKRKTHSGTTVIVRDLFYKFPVRRRHFTATPYQHVVITESLKRLIVNFALCFQNINFTLVDNARNTKILMVKKAKTCQDTFRQLFGLEMIKYTKYLDMHEDKVKLEGFFSTHGYPNKAHQYIFINNYFIPNSNNELYKVVIDLFSSSNFLALMEQKSTLTTKARPAIHKHPIFVIKFICPDWNYYEINSYLETLTEHSAYDLIKKYLIQFTNKFLRLAGLLTKKGDKRDVNKKKRSRPISIASECTSIKNRESPYLRHSPSVSQMFHNNSTRSNISTPSPGSTFSAEESDFVTWWDPNLNQIFYIDQRTGNSYLSIPTTWIQNSHTQNSIDRSHLKRIKTSHSEETTKPITTRITQSNAFDSPHKLSKFDIQNSLVLGQVDSKYIIVKLNQGFVMIDQHAADERIKLEEMIKPSCFKPTTLESSICIELDSPYEYQIVTSDRSLKFLKIWGIHVVTISSTSSSSVDPLKNTLPNSLTENSFAQSRFFISTSETSPHFENKKNYLNRIYVTQLPALILDRCVANHVLLKDIIRDYAYWIKDQNQGDSLSKACPKGIMEILKSKACRSAIMFNDVLTKNQCKEIVERLARCDFPFQCAHGRPSIVPMNPELKSIYTPKRKITWNNIMKNSKTLL